MKDRYEGATPPPWIAERSIIHDGNPENYICQVAGFPHGWALEELINRGDARDVTAIANAKLIADAPKLAEQNEKMLVGIKAWAKSISRDRHPVMGREMDKLIAEVEEGKCTR